MGGLRHLCSLFADVMKLEDMSDLGSGGRSPWGFKSLHPHRGLGCVAQLVEHWAFNLVAVGSSPATPIGRVGPAESSNW